MNFILAIPTPRKIVSCAGHRVFKVSMMDTTRRNRQSNSLTFSVSRRFGHLYTSPIDSTETSIQKGVPFWLPYRIFYHDFNERWRIRSSDGGQNMTLLNLVTALLLGQWDECINARSWKECMCVIITKLIDSENTFSEVWGCILGEILFAKHSKNRHAMFHEKFLSEKHFLN